jgi:threonine dehydrogenase-like Zn-dependent dehydrogenase
MEALHAADVEADVVPGPVLAELLAASGQLAHEVGQIAVVPAFFGNITVGGGPAPVRAYLDELLPDVLEGSIDPGRVFDRTVGLDGVPDGYRAMADRESIKVMVTP